MPEQKLHKHNPKEIRKSVIADASFQRSFVATALLVAGVPMGFSVFVLIRIFLFAERAPIRPQGYIRGQIVLFCVLSFLWLLACSIAALLAGYRVAGPLYRLKRHFEDALKSPEKEVTPLKFREGDFFISHFEPLNDWLKKKNQAQSSKPPDS